MTRNCQTLIAQTNDEYQIITPNTQCFTEINFWHINDHRLNNRSIFLSPKVNKIICTDASSVGSGAIICNDNHVAHTNLTWRELETILFALYSFLPFISNPRAELFTDNQAAAKIIETGSMKCHLHELAFEIFDFCLKNRIRLSRLDPAFPKRPSRLH